MSPCCLASDTAVMMRNDSTATRHKIASNTEPAAAVCLRIWMQHFTAAKEHEKEQMLK
jgi:hypothetical protein